MTEPKKLPPQATAVMIHDEAQRARLAAESVLETLTGTREGDPAPDPLEELLMTLQALVQGQAVILRRLDAIERRISGQQGGSAR